MTSIQIFGIIAGIFLSGIGLLLNAFATFKSIKSRRLSNYQEITKSHREIWKLTIDTPEKFNRIFNINVDLATNPVTDVESRYIHFVLLHMTSAFNFSKENEMMEIEKLKYDFDDFLSYPIPRFVWIKSKRFFNRDFIDFVDKPYRKKMTFFEKFYDVKPKTRAIKQNKWNVLVLSGTPEKLIQEITKLGDNIIIPNLRHEITPNFIKNHNIDFIVCYGYSKIISKDVINLVDIINIHFSLLPEHKGPNPHLWSWLQDTTKGITIHYISEGIDEGDIIDQVVLEIDESFTLESSYKYFETKSLELFERTWPLIRQKSNPRTKQIEGGSNHKMKDQEPLKDLFENGGLELPILEFVEEANKILNKNGTK